jgi:hypothetical protein
MLAGKLQIGRRRASGWTMLTQSTLPLSPNVEYHLKLTLNGASATIDVNGAAQLSHTFAAPLNTGMIGLGTDNSFSRFDNLDLQVLALTVPLSIQESFNANLSIPTASQTGFWQLGDGRYQASPLTGSDDALTTWGIGVSSEIALRLQTTLKTLSNGGLIFDYQNELNFRFIGLFPGTQQLVIGHRDALAWNVDAVLNYSFDIGIDYQLTAYVEASSVSVSINGQSLLSWSSATLLNDGYIGLFSLKGTTTFDDFSLTAYIP